MPIFLRSFFTAEPNPWPSVKCYAISRFENKSAVLAQLTRITGRQTDRRENDLISRALIM